MTSPAKRDYLAFAKKHGGDAAKVQIDNGYYLFPDGAFATIPGGRFSDAIYGIPEAPLYAGPNQRRQVAQQVAANIATYWDARSQIADIEFRELKRELKRDLREHGIAGDPADIARLKELRAEAQACRRELRRAERAAEKLDPSYRTPQQQREDEEYEAAISDAASAYESLLNAITL